MEYKTLHKIRDGMIVKLGFNYSEANSIRAYEGSKENSYSYNVKSYYRR